MMYSRCASYPVATASKTFLICSMIPHEPVCQRTLFCGSLYIPVYPALSKKYRAKWGILPEKRGKNDPYYVVSASNDSSRDWNVPSTKSTWRGFAVSPSMGSG